MGSSAFLPGGGISLYSGVGRLFSQKLRGEPLPLFETTQILGSPLHAVYSLRCSEWNGKTGCENNIHQLSERNMIPADVEKALAAQINQEFSAAYNYLAMSAWFDREGLDGFAHWMQMQHQEENMHAMKLFRYLLDRGGKVELDGIGKPRMEFSGVKEVFETALEQERGNTESINRLYALAGNQSDFATKSHLQWFLDEQVEEEKSIEDVIALLERAGSDPSALLYLNDKMGGRTDQGEANQ